MVCVMAQRLAEQAPAEMHTKTRIPIAIFGLSKKESSATLEAKAIPPAAKVLRTRLTEPPAAIHRSDSQPQRVAESPNAKNANPPATDMVRSEKWRSRTRYEGNQLISKYKR